MAAFSAPDASAIMGSVRRDQLSVASAILGTMRTAGLSLSVALLGGIAASQLGALGGRLLFTHGDARGASGLAARAVEGLRAGLPLRDADGCGAGGCRRLHLTHPRRALGAGLKRRRSYCPCFGRFILGGRGPSAMYEDGI